MQKKLSYFLWITTLSYSSLFAEIYTVSVADDNGTGQVGTFSAAINSLNQSATSGEILLEIDPYLTGQIPAISETVSIAGSNTIYFNTYSLSVTNDSTTYINASIVLDSPSLQVSQEASLYINGNISDLYALSMSGDTLTVSGTTFIDSYGAISLTNGTLTFSETLTTSGTASPGFYVMGANATLNFDQGVTVSCTSTGCGLAFSVTDGTLNFANATNGGAIEFIAQGGTVDLSNNTNYSTYGLDVQLLSGTLTLSSEANITGPSSGGSLFLEGGTLNIIGDTDLSESYVVFASSSSVSLNVDSGYTLTISTLQVSPNSSSSSVSLTFIGYGDVVIESFNFTPYSPYATYPNTSTDPYTLTLNGILTGTNGLLLSNNNIPLFTLILTEDNTFTGPTTIGNAIGPTTLQVNSGASFGTTSDLITIETYSSLIDNGAVYASSITNNGSLSGSGTVTLPSGSYVIVNGSLQPGSSPTQLTILGNVRLNSGSILEQYVEPGASATLLVSESMEIASGSTLQINPEAGCYSRQGETHEILSASAISGTFDHVNIRSVLLTPSLTYSPTGISLTITPNPLSDIATTGNPHAVAQTIDSLLNSGNSALCKEIGKLINATEKEILSALNQMQPSQLKAFAISQENNAVKVRDTLSFRFQRELDSIQCSVDPKPFHAWVSGFGDALHQGTPKYLEVGYQENMAGVSAGMDAHFAKVLYAGILGAYTDSDVKWQKDQGTGSIQSGYAGLYFSALGKMFYGNASILGAWNHYSAHRNIHFPIQRFTASSNHGGAQLLSHVDTGINLGWKGFTIRPFDSFDYISQTENGFTEKGAGSLDLTVNKSNAILLRNELGFNFSKCFRIKGSQWTVSPKISWIREVRIKGAQYTAEFAGTETPFTVTGFFPDRSLVSPGVNVTGNMLNDLLTLGLYYNGEFKGNYSDHSYGGQIRFGF